MQVKDWLQLSGVHRKIIAADRAHVLKIIKTIGNVVDESDAQYCVNFLTRRRDELRLSKDSVSKALAEAAELRKELEMIQNELTKVHKELDNAKKDLHHHKVAVETCHLTIAMQEQGSKRQKMLTGTVVIED